MGFLKACSYLLVAKSCSRLGTGASENPFHWQAQNFRLLRTWIFVCCSKHLGIRNAEVIQKFRGHCCSRNVRLSSFLGIWAREMRNCHRFWPGYSPWCSANLLSCSHVSRLSKPTLDSGSNNSINNNKRVGTSFSSHRSLRKARVGSERASADAFFLGDGDLMRTGACHCNNASNLVQRIEGHRRASQGPTATCDYWCYPRVLE